MTFVSTVSALGVEAAMQGEGSADWRWPVGVDQYDTGSGSERRVRLGAYLRALREELGMTQEAVAEDLGVPLAALRSVEQGASSAGGVLMRDLQRLYRAEPASFGLEWLRCSEPLLFRMICRLPERPGAGRT
ncbi:helix-turn-helix domain-containing protein [Rhizosaccharibacter radicis]|uniref:Helix-turn-helix domain-containing protein n=1 Tax=Rhizosaccharibacter radicis TaxID=2782605 RepID=A0ABT1VTC0_9PROT|nr:helix-turn-helix domain-containing protein [Acetobacteraceae bacterium KSS12]